MESEDDWFDLYFMNKIIRIVSTISSVNGCVIVSLFKTGNTILVLTVLLLQKMFDEELPNFKIKVD